VLWVSAWLELFARGQRPTTLTGWARHRRRGGRRWGPARAIGAGAASTDAALACRAARRAWRAWRAPVTGVPRRRAVRPRPAVPVASGRDPPHDATPPGPGLARHALGPQADAGGRRRRSPGRLVSHARAARRRWLGAGAARPLAAPGGFHLPGRWGDGGSPACARRGRDRNPLLCRLHGSSRAEGGSSISGFAGLARVAP